MLMLQLQIFDKFNKHCKYLLQDLFKHNNIQYQHATMSILPKKKYNSYCMIQHTCKFTHTHTHTQI